MHAPTSSLAQPSGFIAFAYPTPVFRGGTQSTWIGKTLDIKNVQYYSLREGKLTFQLKEGVVFESDSEGKLINEGMKALLATDAVLNQLGITIFEKMNDSGEIETIGLLNGKRGTQPDLIYYLREKTGFNWYRNHYDDEDTRAINFNAINDFAFDRTTFKQKPDGSRFSLKLQRKYEDDPAVNYAIHKIFGQACRLTQRLN